MRKQENKLYHELESPTGKLLIELGEVINEVWCLEYLARFHTISPSEQNRFLTLLKQVNRVHKELLGFEAYPDPILFTSHWNLYDLLILPRASYEKINSIVDGWYLPFVDAQLFAQEQGVEMDEYDWHTALLKLVNRFHLIAFEFELYDFRRLKCYWRPADVPTPTQETMEALKDWEDPIMKLPT